MRNWPLGSLMLVLASACGPTTGTEGKSGGPEVGSEATTATASTAGAATGTTAHGEATKAAGTESTETSDGTSGGPTGACENPAFPVTVPLCGDKGPPCQVIADEPIAATPAIRGGTPALALRGDCSPVVIFNELPEDAEQGPALGWYAERAMPGAWAVEALPMAFPEGALATDPAADQTIAILSDWDGASHVWRREAGVWMSDGSIPGFSITRAGELIRDPQGRLHVGHVDNQAARYSLFDGAWSAQTFLNPVDPSIVLAADMTPRMATWAMDDGVWTVMYVPTPGEVVFLWDNANPELTNETVALALTGDETPWLLFRYHYSLFAPEEIKMIHRLSPTVWQGDVVADAMNPDAKSCPGGLEEPQPEPDELCDYDALELYPLALFASGDDVRALYLRHHRKGTLMANCDDFPCVWEPVSNTSTGELRLAWPGADPAGHPVLADDVFTRNVDGRLDPEGRIHLVFYDDAGEAGTATVRYMQIGP